MLPAFIVSTALRPLSKAFEEQAVKIPFFGFLVVVGDDVLLIEDDILKVEELVHWWRADGTVDSVSVVEILPILDLSE